MSLYAIVHGEQDGAEALLHLVQAAHPINVGRYRDAWVERDGDAPVIRIHTRNGGGNREDYADAITSMQAHPWYDRDEDDDFDSTYADFYFRPDPAQLDPATAARLVEMAGDPVDMGDRWQAAIEAIRSAPARVQASDG